MIDGYCTGPHRECRSSSGIAHAGSMRAGSALMLRAPIPDHLIDIFLTRRLDLSERPSQSPLIVISGTPCVDLLIPGTDTWRIAIVDRNNSAEVEPNVLISLMNNDACEMLARSTTGRSFATHLVSLGFPRRCMPHKTIRCASARWVGSTPPSDTRDRGSPV